MKTFKKGQIVKTSYGETLEVMCQIGIIVHFYNASPCHVGKVFKA